MQYYALLSLLCRRSFYHKDISCPKSLPARKCLSFVSFICPCSTLLPGAGARCAHRQQPKTGPGLKAVMGFPPPRFSPGRPHCVVPLLRGCDWTEVSLWAVHVMANDPPQVALGRTFTALTFDVILLTGCSLQMVLAYSPHRFALSSWTANVSLLLDMTACRRYFSKSREEKKYPSTYFHVGRTFCTPCY